MRYFLLSRSLGALAALGFVWLLNFGARAQTFDWATSTNSLPPASAARGLKTVSGAFGNTYVTGDFTGTVAFGATILSSSGSNAAFVAKLDSSGNWLWAKQAGNSGLGLALDGSDNVLVTGSFAGATASFGTIRLTSSGSSDLFVAKLDGNGNWLWARKAGGTGGDGGTGVAVDGRGNVLLTGSFQSPTASFGATTLTNSGSGSNDVFVAKLDGSGNWLWARQAGGTGGEVGRSVAVDGSGNVLLTGNFVSASASFGTTTLTSSGNVFVAKLDGNGNWLWARQAGGTSGVGGTSGGGGSGVVADGSGNVLLTGYFQNPTASFGATTLTNSSSGSSDAFVAKLDGSGNWLWANKAGGASEDSGQGVAVDGSGNVLLTGSFQSPTASFGTTTLTNSDSNGFDDVFVAKLDGSGNWLWAQQAGGTGIDRGFGLAVDGRGNVLLTGAFASPTVSFGVTTLNNNGNNSDQVFVARLRGAGSPTALAPSAAASTAGLAPNPAHEWVQFSGLPAAAPVQLVDATGRLVRTRPAAGPNGAGVFPLAGVPAGVYVLRAGAVTRRLVVE